MAEETIVKHDGREYTVEVVKSGGTIVGLAPTLLMADLNEALQAYSPELVFKLFLRQLRTDHKNTVRAGTNGKASATGVIDAIARKIITTQQIEKLQEPLGKDKSGVWNLPFMDAANQLLQTDADPKRIHWSVGEVKPTDDEAKLLQEMEADEEETE